MAGIDPKVKAIIEILLADKGTKAAVLGMAKAKAGADQTSASLGRMETQSSKLGQALARWLGAAAIGRLVQTSVVKFAELERRFTAISNRMQALGIDANAQFPRVRAFLEQLQEGGGGLLRETVPAFDQLLGVTRDVDAALTSLSLASDLSEAGFGDVTKTAGLLVNVLQGRAKEAAKEFGIQLLDVNGRAKTQVEIVQELIGTYQGFGDRVKDTQQDIDTLGAAWSKFTDNLGKAASGPLKALVGVFSFLLNTIRSIGPSLDFVFGKISGFGRGLAEAFEILLDPSQFGAGFGERVAAAFARGFEDASARARSAGDELAEIWGTAGEKAAADFEKGREAIEAQARRNQLEENRKEAEKAAKEAAEAAKRLAEVEFDTREQALTSELDLVAAAAEKEKDLRLAVSGDTLREMERLDLALADVAQERALARAKEEKADLLAVEEAFALAKAAILEKYDDLRAQQERERALRILQANEEERDRLIKISNELTSAQIENARLTAETKRRLALQAAKESIGALTAVFGANKAFSVAEAIVNTYEAAAEALTLPYPYGEIIAAARIATGFGYVRAILSTNPGSGFGRGGGRGHGGVGAGARAQRGAANPLLTPPEFLDRARGGGGGSSSTTNITNDSRTEVHFHGPVVMDRAGERKLGRIVKRAQRRDRSRIIR